MAFRKRILSSFETNATAISESCLNKGCLLCFHRMLWRLRDTRTLFTMIVWCVFAITISVNCRAQGYWEITSVGGITGDVPAGTVISSLSEALVHDGYVGQLVDAFIQPYYNEPNVIIIFYSGTQRIGEFIIWYYITVPGTQGYLADPIWAASAGTTPSPPANSTDQSGKCLGGSEGPYCGEPINIASGNVYNEATDYSTAGSNKLSFTRYYNSRENVNTDDQVFSSSLGTNWRCNYDRYLDIFASVSSGSSFNIVAAQRPDGQKLIFIQPGTQWISDSDVSVNLTQSGSTWTLTDKDDTIETYTTNSASTQAILTSIQYRDGYTQTLNYNSSNQIASVTDSYNRTLSFSYQNGLLQTVTTPDGLVLTYGYDSSGLTSGVLDRLISVSYSTSPQTGQSYLYENSNLPFALTGIIDENGNRFASWTYDENARGLSSQFGTGANFTTVAYNDSDGSRTVTHSLGQQEIYQFAVLQGVPKVTEIERIATTTTAAATKSFTYDTNGYLASESDWKGSLITYVNDSLGRPTKIVEASGTRQARTTSISYFQNYHLPSKIVAPEVTTTFTYDSSGNVLTKTLTDTTTTSVPYKTNGQKRTWTYTWSNGLLTSMQNPRTDVTALTSFVYDSDGALLETTNALGQLIQVSQHTPGGQPLEVVDANGVTTQFTYDARLRMTSSSISTAAGFLTTSYTYDPAGNLLGVTLPDGSALANSYDIAHRLTGVADLLNQTIAYTLDAAGDRTQIAVANAAGTLQRQQASSFDALGRRMQDIGGAGQKTEYAYDTNDNVLSITDPLNHVSTQVFDSFNRLTETVNAAKSVSRTSYDAENHPISVIDPDGGKTTYIYDGFGDVIEKVSPDSGSTIYTYDPDSNLTEKVDATGATAYFTYDALDRVIAATYPADTNENVAYIYDQTQYGFGVGRLTTVQDAAGTSNRSYDERGNVVNETRVAGTATLKTQYSYDAAGHIASIVYPSGWTVTYDRDVMGSATSVTVTAPGAVSAQTVAANIGYRPFGPVSALTFGNGIRESRSFDGDYRLTKLTSAGGSALQSLAYSYDAADNVLSMSDAVTSHNSQSFKYDVLNRLTSATGGYGKLSYKYDHNGNRLSQYIGTSSTLYTYALHTNRLATITAGGAIQTVSYTAAGNISSTGSSPNIGLSYNQAGRLASVTSGSQNIAQYAYDAFGKRLSKSTAAGQTLYQYDQQGHLLGESAGNGSPIADYIYLDDGRLIATLSPSTGSLYYIHCDRLGTPQLATNSTQAVVWSTAYQPFGQTGAVTGSITQNLRLPGQYFDAETGWYQNGFRDYVPALGRYLESDPIGLVGGLNTYAYAFGNPLHYTDPTGEIIIPILIAGYEAYELGEVLLVLNEIRSGAYLASFAENIFLDATTDVYLSITNSRIASATIAFLVGYNDLQEAFPESQFPAYTAAGTLIHAMMEYFDNGDNQTCPAHSQ